jgi:hypothetical protein
MNFESHVQFADRCAPIEDSNSAANSILLALQFQEVSVRLILPGLNFWGFIMNKFNINAKKLTSECAKGLDCSPFDTESPCHPLTGDGTKILHVVYQRDVPSF